MCECARMCDGFVLFLFCFVQFVCLLSVRLLGLVARFARVSVDW